MLLDVHLVYFIQVHVAGHRAHVAPPRFQGDFLQRGLIQMGDDHVPPPVFLKAAGAVAQGDGGAAILADPYGENFYALLFCFLGRLKRGSLMIFAIGYQDEHLGLSLFGVE